MTRATRLGLAIIVLLAGAWLRATEAIRIEDVYILAETQKWQDDHIYVAEGNALFDTGEYIVQADKVTYDQTTGDLEATGKVVFKSREATLYSDHFKMNTITGLGSGENIELYSAPYFISGKRVEKAGPDTYIIYEGEMTACTQRNPHWKMKVGKVKVNLRDYMYLTNARLYAGPVPSLYIPYLVYPIKDERTSGLLIPRFGYGERSGYNLSNTYYWAPTNWFDSATTLNLYSRLGQGIAQEVRYMPDENSIGRLNAYYISERNDAARRKLPGESLLPLKRWMADYYHYQPFGKGLLAYADVHYVSDPLMYAHHGQDFINYSRSFNASEVRLSQERPSYGWLASVKRQEQFFTQQVPIPPALPPPAAPQLYALKLVSRATPALNFHMNETRLAGQFTVAAEATYDGIRKDYDVPVAAGIASTPFDYNRLTFTPKLTWSPLALPQLKAKLEVAGYYLRYSKTTDPLNALVQVDKPLTRRYARGRVGLIGPSFYRLFDGNDGVRWRHSFGADMDYTMSSAVGEQNRVPVFDARDLAVSAERLYSLVFHSRLARKAEARSQPEERFGASLTFLYSAGRPLTLLPDGTTSRFGPAGLNMRMRLGQRLAVDARYYYSFTAGRADSISVSGHFEDAARGSYVDLNYTKAGTINIAQYQLNQGTADSTLSQALAAEQVRLLASQEFFGGHVGLSTGVNYDLGAAIFRSGTFQLRLKSQCVTLITQTNIYNLNGQLAREYRFSVDFLGLGNLINTTSTWPKY